MHRRYTVHALLNSASSPSNLRRSVENINEKLRGTKHLDLFQSARVDSNVSIEESIRALIELKNEGKLDHIGMSECSAATLRRGNAVGPSLWWDVEFVLIDLQIHPISVVEIEISPWSYEEETKNGTQGCISSNDSLTFCLVIATAKELGIAVAGYS